MIEIHQKTTKTQTVMFHLTLAQAEEISSGLQEARAESWSLSVLHGSPQNLNETTLLNSTDGLNVPEGIEGYELHLSFNDPRCLGDLEPLGRCLTTHRIFTIGEDCSWSIDLAPLQHLKSLEFVRVINANEVTGLSAFKEHRSLRKLEISCQVLSDFPTFHESCSLRSLKLNWGDGLSHLSIGGDSHLEDLDLSGQSLEELKLDNFSNLQTLSLAMCSNLSSLDLLNLTALRKLDLQGCAALKVHGQFRDLKTVMNLNLARYGGTSAPNLVGMERLEVLDLRNSPKLEDLNGLGDLPALTTLWLRDCPGLTRVRHLTRFRALNKVDLDGSNRVLDLDALVDCQNLRQLNGPDQPATYAVLAKTAASTGDAAFIEKNIYEWIDSVKHARGPDLLIRRLTLAIHKCTEASWAKDAFTRLATHARRRSGEYAAAGDASIEPKTWADLARSVMRLGHPGLKAPVEQMFADLTCPPEHVSVLAPALEALADLDNLTSEGQQWAINLVEQTLATLSEEQLRTIAPEAALFHASFGRSERVTELLKLGTVQDDISVSDRVHLALARRAIFRKRWQEADSKILEIKMPALKDQGYMDLARSSAQLQPGEAIAALAKIDDPGARAGLASELASSPGVREQPDTLARLALTLQEHPETFGSLLNELIQSHPDSEEAAAVDRAYRRPPEDHLELIIAWFLERESLSRAITEQMLQACREDLVGQLAELRGLVLGWAVERMQKGGRVSPRTMDELRQELEMVSK